MCISWPKCSTNESKIVFYVFMILCNNKNATRTQEEEYKILRKELQWNRRNKASSLTLLISSPFWQFCGSYSLNYNRHT